MTEKVQKIREEVVRMHNLLPFVDGDNISVNYADRICTTLEMYIDSLQEEPVSEQNRSNVERTVKNWKESVSDDLEKASTKYAQDKYMPVQTSQAFKAGAKWKEEQMIAKAIDGEVLEIEDNDSAICSYTHLDLYIEPYTLEKNGFENNDKVKVIIIKED